MDRHFMLDRISLPLNDDDPPARASALIGSKSHVELHDPGVRRNPFSIWRGRVRTCIWRRGIVNVDHELAPASREGEWARFRYDVADRAALRTGADTFPRRFLGSSRHNCLPSWRQRVSSSADTRWSRSSEVRRLSRRELTKARGRYSRQFLTGRPARWPTGAALTTLRSVALVDCLTVLYQNVTRTPYVGRRG